MDGSNNAGVNTSHLPRPDSASNGFNIDNAFLGGMQHFADSSDVNSGHDDIASFLHPDLFEQNDHGSTAQQQDPPAFQSAFNQHASRQTQSPALPQYNPSQPQFSSQSQFPQQPMFDSRTMYQQSQSFDPRMFQQQRSTQSPAPFDHFPYPAASANQNYLQQPPQQRQSATPNQQFAPPRQQTYSPYGGWDSRSTTNFVPYQNFQEQSQPSSHNFVDPSIFHGNQLSNMNGNYPSLAPRQQQYHQSPYFPKAGSGVTIDPRTLQGQGQQPFPFNQQQRLQEPMAQTGMLVPPQPETAVKKKAPKDPNAPKKSQSKSRKDDSATKQPRDGSSDSDSDLSIANEPEPKPAILSVSMPADMRGQTLYKAVEAVWADRHNPAPVEKIKSGIADFGNVVKSFRDIWKDRNEKLKKAEIEGSSTSSQAPLLKKEVSDDRGFMELIMTRSLQLGHPTIIKSLGENQWVMSALYSFMLDRVTAGDLDSVLVTAILKLAVNFDTLDDAKLENLKWPKLLQRLTKKATNDSKILAQKIITNAAALTSKKKAEGNQSSLKPNSESSTVGVKRVRDGEAGQPVPKKTLLKPSSKPLALQNAERRRALEKEEAAKKAKEAKEAPANTNAPPSRTVAKPKVTLPPKSTAFASLMSASKKPGTSNAERAAAAKDKPPGALPTKKEATSRDSPPRNGAASSRSSASFLGGILSDFEKKKEVKAEKEDEPLNETPEQKAKRLRKESRRKLRVSWKADNELTEIRHFTHDPDEEIGHDDSMVKDVGDTMKEGEMLKRKMGMSDLEDEEDDDEKAEDTYSPPSEVDFSVMPAVDIEQNGIKFGGPIKPESASTDAQEKLEANILMVVYDSKADRPISPKEPPDEGDDDNFQPCLDFGEPDEKVRIKERDVLGRQQPVMGGSSGIDLSALAQRMQQPPTGAPPPPGSALDLQSILNNLGRQQPGAAPQPSAPAPALDLKTLVDNFHKAQQRPQPFQPPPPQPASGPAVDLGALLAAYQQSSGGNGTPHPGKHTLDDAEDSEKKKGKLPPNYKTQVCSFWKEGRCTKGDNCTYKHVD